MPRPNKVHELHGTMYFLDPQQIWSSTALRIQQQPNPWCLHRSQPRCRAAWQTEPPWPAVPWRGWGNNMHPAPWSEETRRFLIQRVTRCSRPILPRSSWTPGLRHPCEGTNNNNHIHNHNEYLECLTRTSPKCLHILYNHILSKFNAYNKNTYSSGQWDWRKVVVFKEKGFQARFKRADRGRMADRNRMMRIIIKGILMSH